MNQKAMYFDPFLASKCFIFKFYEYFLAGILT